MSDPINPFLDDDDEFEASAAPAAAPVFRIQRPATAPATEPVAAPVQEQKPVTVKAAKPEWGHKGFRKGVPNPHKGSPRARVTEATAPLLALVGKFPGATAEAASLVSVTQPIAHLDYAGGQLRTVAGTMKQLRKFEAMGLVTSYKSKAEDAVTHWGITEEGVASAQSFGFLEAPNEASPNALSGISFSRLNHYRFIALVAAQFACPTGEFKKATGYDPVSLDQLVSEPQIRRDFHETSEQLKEFKKQGKSSDWGIVRARKLAEARADIAAGKYTAADLFTVHPTLKVAGLPASSFTNGSTKTQHMPDFLVQLPNGQALMGEIELSRKHWDEYASLFLVYANDRDKERLFKNVLYFTHRKDIASLMKRVDKSLGTELFASGYLNVRQLVHRDLTPVKLKSRIGD